MIGDIVLQKDILQLAHQRVEVVFTSMNAVESVRKYLGEIKPDWKVFCIGSATKNLITRYFGGHSIAGTADSASALAGVIIKERNISSVTFFCGDKRRDELPNTLRGHHIEVNEIEVYKTIETPAVISKGYEGILFYSPSAVASFFSKNKIDGKAVLFAIGATTADEIKKFSDNKIIIADKPAKELLAEQAMNYFTKNPIHH